LQAKQRVGPASGPQCGRLEQEMDGLECLPFLRPAIRRTGSRPELRARQIAGFLGGDIQERSWKVLKKGGILISVVQPPSEEEAAKHGAKASMFARQPNSGELEIAKLIDAGKVKVFVETGLPLSEVKRAKELSQAGHVRGKIVLKVA
jgi:hypothetical protein